MKFLPILCVTMVLTLFPLLLSASEPRGIYGIHDHSPVPTEYLNRVKAVADGAWVTATVGVGANTNDMSGEDFTFLASQGHAVICRINYGYYPDGTIPVPAKWDDFAKRCANFVANSSGCNIWLIGNELNLAAEWPFDGAQFVSISPQDYATCFRKCYDAIKAIRPNDKILPQPCAPWAGPYGSGFQNVNGTNYPHAGMPITWTQYQYDMLAAIAANGPVDGIALHIGSRGYAYSDIHSTNKFGGLNLYSSFYTYKDWVDYGIPPSLYHLPLYATECNGMFFWKGGHPEDASKHYEAGWVQEIFAEINRYNQGAALSGKPIFRCVNFYRWCGFCDGWNMDGASNPYREQILSDLDAAVAQNYTWPTNVVPTNAPAAPANLSVAVGYGNLMLTWDPVPGASGYKIKTANGSVPPSTNAFTLVTNLSATSYIDTRYYYGPYSNYYFVIATNALGESPPSNIAGARPTNSAPDVIVTNITWAPSNLVAGSSVVFRASVLNQGTAGTPSGTTLGVGFLVDGTQVSWSGSYNSTLFANSSVTLTANGGPNGTSNWIATPGPHTITAVADDINRFPEGNENNNGLTQHFTVEASGYAFNSGGVAAGAFSADANYSGSTGTFSVTNSIDTSSVFAPAPASVYQSERWNDFSYTLPYLAAGKPYTVRLHFAEISPSVNAIGQRQFHVAINGSQVLTNFDIFAAAGGKYRAVIREFTTVASVSSNIVVQLIQGAANEPKLSGIEVIQGLPPMLAPIASKTVHEGTMLAFSALGTSLDPGQKITDFENFSTYMGLAKPMFQPPHISPTTSTNIDPYSYIAVVSASAPGANSRTGTNVLNVQFRFLNTANPWLRLTTANAPNIPNPTVDFMQGIRFDIYTRCELKLALGLRETGTSTNIGANGGTTGPIEFVGVLGTNGIAPVPVRTIPASNWVTLTFNPNRERIVAFPGSGNGILQSATGKGVLEELAIVSITGNETNSIYLDNFEVVPSSVLTYSLVSGPPGASIDATNGVFAWRPAEGQGPGVYEVSIRVAKNGVLTDSKTFSITVLESNQPPVLNAISNQVVNAGSTLALAAVAFDPDFPTNFLAFSLGTNAPLGSSINASSGLFSWTTPNVTSTTTNSISLHVTDDGIPPLSDAKMFNVVVVAPPRVSTISTLDQNVNLTWRTFPGKTYRVEFKNDLLDANWTPLGESLVAPGENLSLTNSIAGNQQRYYRIVRED